MLCHIYGALQVCNMISTDTRKKKKNDFAEVSKNFLALDIKLKIMLEHQIT